MPASGHRSPDPGALRRGRSLREFAVGGQLDLGKLYCPGEVREELLEKALVAVESVPIDKGPPALPVVAKGEDIAFSPQGCSPGLSQDGALGQDAKLHPAQLVGVARIAIRPFDDVDLDAF